MWRLCMSNRSTLELGLLLIRMGIGFVFMVYGALKLLSGPAKWIWLGQQLAPFGITFLPAVWGFIAANVEFFGGLCLIFGFATRPVALLLVCLLTVALTYHVRNGDGFEVYAQALLCMVIAIAFLISGPGKYALDTYLCDKYQSKKAVE